MGNFVFGFDHETPEVFDLTLDFAFRSEMELAQFRALVPYPGTPLYARLLREGRLIDPAWWRNPTRIPGEATPLIFPKRMSPEQLAEGMLHLAREFYGLGGRLRRLRTLRPWRRSLMEMALLIGTDWAFGSRYSSAFRFSLDRIRSQPVAVRQRVSVCGALRDRCPAGCPAAAPQVGPRSAWRAPRPAAAHRPCTAVS